MMMQPELLTDAVKIYRVRGLEEQQQGSGVEASRELPQPVAHLACYPTLGRHNRYSVNNSASSSCPPVQFRAEVDLTAARNQIVISVGYRVGQTAVCGVPSRV